MNNTDKLALFGIGLLALSLLSKAQAQPQPQPECWEDGTIECLDNPVTCNLVI